MLLQPLKPRVNRVTTGQLTRVLDVNNIQKKLRHGDTSQASASKALCLQRKVELFGPGERKRKGRKNHFGANGVNAQQDERKK
jgi:hypothetical protein